jgi:hypothetical protein
MTIPGNGSDNLTTTHGPEADGPVDGALLPLMRINGKLYVVPITLHFYYPAVTRRPAKPRTDGGRTAGAPND